MNTILNEFKINFEIQYLHPLPVHCQISWLKWLDEKKKKKFNQIFWVFKFNDFKLNIIFRVLLLLQTNWLFGCQNRIDNFAYAGYQFHVLTGISKKCISRTSCIIKVHDKKIYCSKQILKVFFYRRQTTLNLKCPTELMSQSV